MRRQTGETGANVYTTAPPYGLGYDPELLRLVVEERMTAQARAEAARLLADVGRPAKTLDHKALAAEQYGESAAYLTARIARDRPDVLEDMKAGKYASVRASWWRSA